MGIANTTASAALIAAFTGAEAADVTGRGTGIDDQTHCRTRSRSSGRRSTGRATVTTRWACSPRSAASSTPAWSGSCWPRPRPACRSCSTALIAGAAALVAQAIAPDALDYCFAGHRSAEPGHQVALAQLGLRPLVDLDLRLGEGTGAALAFPFVEAAGAVLREMATFDSAGVARK